MTNTQEAILIYLADDDIEDKAIFIDTLKGTMLNADLTHFDDGLSLIEYLDMEEAKPNIIFLDLNMPGKSGKQCLKEIRNNPVYNNIPVVIFTATSYMKDIKDTYEFGANLYVPKNIFIKNNVAALQMILETVLNQSDLSPDRERYVLGDATVFRWI